MRVFYGVTKMQRNARARTFRYRAAQHDDQRLNV